MRSIMRHMRRAALLLMVASGVVLSIDSVALAVDQTAFFQPRVLPKRWVIFDLQNSSAQGVVPRGKAIELAVVLGGVPAGGDPIIAMFESAAFQSQRVYLSQDSTPLVWRGMAALAPHPASRTSIQPKAVRIRVTFARERNQKLDRILTRVVYVTIGRPDPQTEGQDVPASIVVEKTESGATPDEVQPDVEPVANALIAEEDLMPLPAPNEGKPYWQQVSHLISRSWGRHVRSVRRAPVRETVRVRFKLYPSGRAQLIEVEKGSGAREVDEAGIQAIVQAHPFPPFPAELGTETVDVHVRMRTGLRTGLRDAQVVTGQPQDKSSASAPVQQK